MNDNPRTIRPMKCSGSDEHDEMQLVMKSGEVLESKSVWHNYSNPRACAPRVN